MPTKKSKPKAKLKPKVKTKKKVVAKPLPKSRPKLGKLIGRISHYFSDIEVGVINVSASLSQGDQIRIVGGENTDFNQKVASMQVDHEQVKKAKKGDSVGLKTEEKVREGYRVYRV